MAKETAGFESMGYGGSMGSNVSGSISGVKTTSAVSTDVGRQAKQFSRDSLHKSGKRSGKIRMSKKRK